MYDSGSLLRSLIQSCPFSTLSIDMYTKAIFSTCMLPWLLVTTRQQLILILAVAKSCCRLRTLHPTIVKYPGDDALSAGAPRIAKINPIEKVALDVHSTELPSGCPFLYLSFPYPFVHGHLRRVCDDHGLQLSLSVWESSRLVCVGARRAVSQTQYVRGLRPLSSPSHRKSGVWGLLSLLLKDRLPERRCELSCFTGCSYVSRCGAFSSLGVGRQVVLPLSLPS
jgi:hypothetical protein